MAKVVLHALAKDPADRLPSAHAFALDLATAATTAYGRGWTARSELVLHLADDVRDAAFLISHDTQRSTTYPVNERIFLCHSSGDKNTVRELYRRLRRDSLSPWLDEEDILPGQSWEDEIRRAIKESRYVLVCLSKSSVTKRGYVQKEIRQALDVAEEQPEGSIFLIPVRLESCEVPNRLSDRQWVDLFAENGYERLLFSLRWSDGKESGVQGATG